MHSSLRRTLSAVALLVALAPLAGCAGKASKWIWNPFADQEFKDDLGAITGRSGYTGMSSKSREVERSLNSHF